jgi:hypothetical protein
MPFPCVDRRPAPRRSPAPGRNWFIAGAALLCLLVAGNARASIQGRHVAARIGHAVGHSRCLPVPTHADPFSSDMPLVVVFSSGRPSGVHVLIPVRAVRAVGNPDPSADAGARQSANTCTVTLLPSHWGATHLSV